MIGSEIKAARIGAGLTLRGLGDQVGTDFTYLSKIENGHDRPSRDLVRRIDTALNAEGQLEAAFDNEPCPKCGSLAIDEAQLVNAIRAVWPDAFSDAAFLGDARAILDRLRST